MKFLRISTSVLTLLLCAQLQAATLGSVTTSGGNWPTVVAPDINDDLSELYKRALVRSVTAGTSAANAFTATSAVLPFTVLSDGLTVSWVATAGNTGASTFVLDGIAGTPALVNKAGVALTTGQIESGTLITARYISASSHWRVVSGLVEDDVPEAGDFGALALTGDVTSVGLATTITANSVALTTDTTGSYAAGDAEAGNALTGDSATAFFAAGAIEVARGGTGAAPALDDQVLISSSTSAAAWTSIPDSDAAGTILGYDVTTNAFSTKADDDVPEAGDFAGLTATLPITQSGGTISTSMATARLLGRTTAATGVAEEISAGSFLSLSGLSLNLSDTELTSIGNLTSAADRLPYYTGAGTAALATFTSFGRSLADDSDATAGRATLVAAGLAVANTFTANQEIEIPSSSSNLTIFHGNVTNNAAQYIGSVYFKARNSLGLTKSFGEVAGDIVDGSNGTEDGKIRINTSIAGSEAERFNFGAGLYSVGATGGDQGANSINASSYFLNGTNFTSTFQPLDTDLTCYAGLTSAADKIGYFTGVGTCAVADFSSAVRTLITTPSSANLRTMLNDELGTGPLFFLGAPAADDQVFVSSSVTAGAWGSIPDSEAAGVILGYDVTTNAFSTKTDDDVPEVADFAALVGGSGIDNNSGTLDLDLTELTTSATLGAGAFTTFTFDAGAVDPAFTLSSGQLLFTMGGTSPIIGVDDQGSFRLFEEDAGGSNYLGFQAPAAVTTDATCVLENDANFIPDTCVGDGSDDDVPEAGDFGALALTGDVTSSGLATTIANNAVTNAKAAQMATLTIKGNNTGGASNALDLTVAQVNTMINSTVAPVFANITSRPTTLSGYGITDAQGLDIELTAIAGLTSAADSVPYYTGAGTAALATLTATGRSLIDDASTSAMLTTLGAAGTAISNNFAADQTISSTDAGALVAPNLILDRNSVSPAASDIIAGLIFRGRDSGAASQDYTSLQTTITDPTAASEDATLDFRSVVAGTFASRFSVGNGLYYSGGSDAGASTVNALNLFVAGANISTLYQPLDSTLTSVAAYNTNGILTQTAADTFVGRAITGTANEIDIANGSGVAGNPTASLPTAITGTGKTWTGGTFSGVTNVGTTTFGDGAGNDKIAFIGEATNPTCAATNYFIWVNTVDLKMKKCQNGTVSDMDMDSGGTPNLSGIVDDVGCTALQVFRRNLTDTGNECGTVAGTGTVTSVATGTGLTGGTITTAGTLLFDFSDAGASPALAVDEARFTSNATVAGHMVFEGDTADAFESRVVITDPTVDRAFTIPNADSVAVQSATCPGAMAGVSSLGVISCTSFTSTTGISAAGTTQGTATALTSTSSFQLFEVTTVTTASAEGVVLPTSDARYRVTIVNRGTGILKVYPASTGTIDGGTASAAISVLSLESITLAAKDASNNWFDIEKSSVFGPGTTTAAPLKITTGTLNTTAQAGATEYDGIQHFSFDASSRGVVPAIQFMTLTANYTLTSQTAAQKLFNTPANGRFTVKAGTTYKFKCWYGLTSMSSTSGSYGFAFSGTATLTSQAWTATASKNASNINIPLSAMNSFQTAAQTTLVTANTNTNGVAIIEGIVRINAAGTLIPSVSLTVAAAAIVQAGSYCELVPIGITNTVTSEGNVD